MLARIIDNGPEVYWEIQGQNRSAGETRERLEEAVAEIDRQCREGADEPFGGLFDKVTEMFGPQLDEYVQLARRLYHH